MDGRIAATDATPPPALFTALVGRGLGVLLLIAAGLKIYGLGVDPVARSGVFSAPAIQFLIVAFELFLGVWLLSGQQSAGAWIVTFATFCVFAIVSGYQGVIGQASCGCFGKVTVNPWIAFTIDLAAVAVLLKWRPDFQSLWQNRTRASLIAAGFVGGYLVLLGSVAGYAHIRHGSIDAALANLRNERLSVYPAMLDMGTGVPDETREATLELTNRTDHPIGLIGGTADCSCTVIDDLPITIQPGESRSITVRMSLPKSTGTFNRKANLLVNDDGLKKVGFRLTGHISKSLE